jgi:hypothetical protein
MTASKDANKQDGHAVHRKPRKSRLDNRNWTELTSSRILVTSRNELLAKGYLSLQPTTRYAGV